MRVRPPGPLTFWVAAAFRFLVGTCIAQNGTVSFTNQVQPILERSCQTCHASEGGQADLSLTSYDAVVRGGRNGAVILPGSSDESLLVRLISGDRPAMPMVGDPLGQEEVELIRQWIAQGAIDDTPADSREGGWWSFRRLDRPAVPEVSESMGGSFGSWPRTSVDRFILRKLEEKGLTPSPEADRRTLIRRLTYDLHGLPPTFAEVEAFVSDTSSGSYRKLVDRLLESPRYGERWGRHWLDAVHYGESHGFDKDKARRNAWPYRDYVIQAFNKDKPYARFVREQLAGDVLFPETAEGLVATGFIAAGPWDHVGHTELREGTLDKKITRNLDRDDMVMTTMSTFASLTVHCARCHDHKFDPIKQADYYSLQSVFAGVDRAEQDYDTDPELFRQRRALLSERRGLDASLQPLLAEVEGISSPEIEAIGSQLEQLDQEKLDLLPKVGEKDTPQTVARRKAIRSEQKVLRERRDRLRLQQMPPESRLLGEKLRARLEALDERIERLPEPSKVYAAATYFTSHNKFTPAWQPRPVHLLQRGSVEAPGPPATPGAIRAVDWLDSRFQIDHPLDEGARRVALAEWLVRPENPFTWRSIVNRVWHHHFGVGLVDSPNDFGRMGSRPTHPELLDWLAVEFRDNGGSLKRLHRLMVTSAVYRQSSRDRPGYRGIDAQNQFLWRMNRRRLDAESVRDSVLMVSDKLDLTMGGPSAEHFLFKDDHSPVYDYAGFDVGRPESNRRAVYRFIVRSVPDPFMESLDCPDASLLTPTRNTTLTAIQALALLNDPFMVRQVDYVAQRARSHAQSLAARIEFLYRVALGRAIREEEKTVLMAYGREHGLENVCRVILNSNEFMFVD